MIIIKERIIKNFILGFAMGLPFLAVGADNEEGTNSIMTIKDIEFVDSAYTMNVNLTRFDGDNGQFDIPTIAFGYELISKEISLIPEIRYGAGDNAEGTDFEIEKYLSLSVKGQWNFQNGLYVFLYPSYSNITLKEKSPRWSCCSDEKQSSWSLSAGAGFGYKIIDAIAIESTVEKSSDYHYFSLGLRFNY